MTKGLSTGTWRDLLARAFAIVRRAFRFWPVVAVSFGIAMIAGAIAPTLIRPAYKSETVLLYREGIQTGNLLGSQYQEESRRQAGMRLREMLLSRSNLERIITELNIFPTIVQSRGMIEAVDELKAHLDCKLRENETFLISYDGDDPETVYAITKKLADSLVDQSSRYRREQTQSTKQFLAAEKGRTELELKAKEEAQAQFLAQHPEFAQDVSATGGGSTAGASVRAAEKQRGTAAGAGDTALQALERQAIRLRHQSRNPARPGTAAPSVPVGPNVDPALQQSINDAEAELASAQRDLVDKQGKYTEQHPDVLTAQRRVGAAQAKVARLRSQASASSPSFLSPPATDESPEESQAKASSELSKVEAAIAAKRSGVDGGVVAIDSNWVVALETEWASLTREVADIRERNQQIQTRFFRASIVASVEASGQAAQMVVIDAPYKPTKPFKRGARRTMATVALITVLLGMTVCFGLALVDDRVYDEVDIRGLEIGPLAHVVPKQLKGKKGIRNV